MAKSKLRKVVIPVAGLGTRVLPATKSIPKELLTLVDRPLIDYVVAEAREAGFEHVVLVTGRYKSAIEDYFDRAFELEATLEARGASKAKILEETRAVIQPAGSMSYTRQQDPLGLGHAVWCARDIVGNEPFAVSLPDVVIKGKPGALKQMVDAYNETGGNIIAVNPVPREETNKYGVVAPAEDGEPSSAAFAVKGMVEKPAPADAPSNYAITGRYILQPEIFDLLANTKKGAGGEIQLTDAMADLMQSDKFYAYAFDGEVWDCGDKLGWLKANVTFGLEFSEHKAAFREFLKTLEI